MTSEFLKLVPNKERREVINPAEEPPAQLQVIRLSASFEAGVGQQKSGY